MEYKKPPIEEIKQALEKTRGNLTNTAKLLGIDRVTLWYWSKNDPEVRDAIANSRKGKLDQFITTAEILALGIPDIDPETKKVIGWVEKPDAGMLKFFMSTLGRDEGFGDAMDLTTNGKDLNSVVQVEIIDKRSDVIQEEQEGE